MSAVRVLGFTRADGRGVLDGVAWGVPSATGPGVWTAAPARSPLGGRLRGQRVADLPFAIDDALWEVELDGDVREEERLVSAARGRLVARVGAWDEACAAAFARDCAERARARVEAMAPGADADLAAGYLSDLGHVTAGAVPPVPGAAVAGYLCARIAGLAAGPLRYAAGVGAERAEQGRRLAALLGLGADGRPAAAQARRARWRRKRKPSSS